MGKDELFGLIVAVQMMLNIGLFLHNRHLAAVIRDHERFFEELMRMRSSSQ